MNAAKDTLGNPLSGALPSSVQHYEWALQQFQCYCCDPLATIETACAERPDFVMGRVLHAWLHLLGTEPAGWPVARADLEQARQWPSNAREQAHLRAIARLIDGHWHGARRVLEDLNLDYPLDGLGLLAGHVLDFYVGDARMLRDRIARAFPAWSPAMPGYHALLGMHAFGLEECGAYSRAAASGHAALLLEPRDAWAHHAVTHVLEMQGRQHEGIAWMRDRQPQWAVDNFFATHNWWHLALFHLDLDEIDAVLGLFDEAIGTSQSPLALDLVDASALLWRLYLRGVDVGDRWGTVADRWLPFADTGHYAFNDAHAMMAFVCDRRQEAIQTLLAAQQRALQGKGDNAMFSRDVGAPLCQAILALVEGHPARTVELLRPLRSIAHRFGGSHAQRDLIDLTLLEAALRDGQQTLARGLAAERVDAKPGSPAARELLRQASG